MTNCGDRNTELPGNIFSLRRFKFDDRLYDLYENHDDPAYAFSRIITGILSIHKGPILEFNLQLPCTPKRKIKSESLNNWIMILSMKGVKHIELVNDEWDLVQTPSHLFSCHGLTFLHLYRFNLSIPPSFSGFTTLLRLRLEFMTFEFGALETLVSGCRLLEELAVSYCSGCECIDLSSSSALIDLTLSLPQNCAFDFNKSLPIIQRLTLELLGKMLLYTDIFPLSQLITSLKYLCLDEVNLDEREELLYIIRVLKSASNLVELDIVTVGSETQAPDPSEELECHRSCLTQLEKVKIRVETGFKHAMTLTGFILANSSSLKALTFDFSFHRKPEASILSSIISEDLLWMKRASQSAHVEFIHQ